MLYQSTGILDYSYKSDYGYRLVVNVDRELISYYRSLIPKYIKSNPQMYAPHISIVRHEIPPKLEYWKKYQGQEIEFNYDNTIHFGKVYCWLNVFCVRLEEIRLELGLPVSSPYTIPPENFIGCFHTTIGNFKK